MVPKGPSVEWSYSRLDKMDCPWWTQVILQGLPHQCVAVCLTSFELGWENMVTGSLRFQKGKPWLGKRVGEGRVRGGNGTRVGPWGNARTWMGWRSWSEALPRMGPKAGSVARGLDLHSSPHSQPPLGRTQSRFFLCFQVETIGDAYMVASKQTSHLHWNLTRGRDYHDVLALPRCHHPLSDWARAQGEAEALDWSPHR